MAVHPSNRHLCRLFTAHIKCRAHKRVRCIHGPHFHKPPVESIARLSAFMVLSLLPVSGLTPRICTPDSIPPSREHRKGPPHCGEVFPCVPVPVTPLLLSAHSHPHGLPHAAPGYFPHHSELQIAADVLQPRKIQQGFDHFPSQPTENFQTPAGCIRNRDPDDIQDMVTPVDHSAHEVVTPP